MESANIQPDSDQEIDYNDEEVDYDDDEVDYNDEFLYLLRTNELTEAIDLLKNRLVTDLNYADKNGSTSLHYCCANNLGTAVVFLLQECKLNYCVFNKSGNSPLHWALQTNSFESVRELLIHDFNVHRSAYQASSPSSFSQMAQLDISQFRLDEETKRHYKISAYPPTYPETNRIDLFSANHFGKTILNEAFAGKNIDILHLILEHPISACLDPDETSEPSEPIPASPSDPKQQANQYAHLNLTDQRADQQGYQACPSDPKQQEYQYGQGGHPGDPKQQEYQYAQVNLSDQLVNDRLTDQLVSSKQVSITHSLTFAKELPPILVRESAVEGEILNAQNPELDLSGKIIWESSIVASYWFNELAREGIFRGKKILELGSGCGLCGLAILTYSAAYQAEVGEILLTDVCPDTLDNLGFNVALNGFGESEQLKIAKLDWTARDTWPRVGGEVAGEFQTFDVIVGSDLICEAGLVEDFCDVIEGLLARPGGSAGGGRLSGGRLFYCFKERRDGSGILVSRLEARGLEVGWGAAPGEFRAAPEGENASLFFPDLECDDFILLEARWKE